MTKDEPAPELDAEQLALCEDAEFWKMIAQRRQSATISREELEQLLNQDDDDSLADDLLAANPLFRQLVEKSKATPRKRFPES